MWNANCGASFEWVGRAISPYLGFLTGWLMIAGYVIGAVAGVKRAELRLMQHSASRTIGESAGRRAVISGMAGWVS